jgi:hypothetical protein
MNQYSSKMKKSFLFISIIFTFSIYSYAQSDCACCTENHKQFDFWVGDWNVYDTIGNKVGENLILKLENNCIINEHWESVNGGSGSSYNYYDQSDSTWNQVWIDSQGSNLVLKGKGEANKMTLKSRLLKGKKVDLYYNQITWTKNKDESVTQVWEIFDKNNQLLSTAFKGIYKKKSWKQF